MAIQVASTASSESTNGAGSGATRLKVANLNLFLNQRSPLSDAMTAIASDLLPTLRETATLSLRDYSFPTTRDEEWRFTDLSPMLALDWTTAGGNGPDITAADIEPYRLPDVPSCLVFVNGEYRSDLSVLDADTAAAVTVGALSDVDTATAIAPKLSQYLAQQQGLEQAFTTLNAASFSDAAVVWLKRGAIAPAPIHVLSVSTSTASAPILTHPRCLVVAESNSDVTLVEDYVTVGETAYFTNPVTEIYVEENARVNHVRVQRDHLSAFHIGKTAVSQARHSRYACHAIGLGAQIARHNLEVFQTGESTETVLNGLLMVSDHQLADTHSLIAYEHPHGMSRQLHKAIVDDRAHAVFNGKVNVPQAAQLTDAGQLNRNLLLSAKGRVDTKPQLEIVADNVKCTHGATVSQLKADEVFYLQSRGIDATRAQNLLIYAFAAEIFEALPVESLKSTLSEAVNVFTR